MSKEIYLFNLTHKGRRKAFNSIILSLFYMLLFIQSSVSFAQLNVVKHGNQQWTHYTNTIRLSNQWAVQSDLDYRWKNTWNEPSLYFVRISGKYYANAKINFAGGYANLGFYNNHTIGKMEHRIYQEACVVHGFKRFMMSHRFRIEERIMVPLHDEGTLNSIFGWRFRYRPQVSIPLIKVDFMGAERSLHVNLGDELMINAGELASGNFFDRNRIMVTPYISWNENLNLALTYNMEYAGTIIPGQLSYNDVLWLTIYHKMDWRSKS